MDPEALAKLKQKHNHQKFLFLALKTQNNALKDEKAELDAELEQLNARVDEQNDLIV